MKLEHANLSVENTDEMERFLMAAFIDFDRNQLSTGFAESPCNPDRGVPGGSADIDRFFIIVFNNYIIQI